MNRQLPRILCLLMAGALLAGCANSTPAKPSETEPEESVVEEQPADTADTAGDEQAALDAYQQFLEEEGFSRISQRKVISLRTAKTAIVFSISMPTAFPS